MAGPVNSVEVPVLRRLLLFVFLVALGLGPALLVAIKDRRPPLDSWHVVTAAARARAAIIDVRGERWRLRCAQLASELATMMRQLGVGEIGKAAEGTLVLHLQARLRNEPHLAELTLYDPRGQPLISTAKAPPAPAGEGLELAQASRRPVLMLASRAGTTELVVAAPVTEPPTTKKREPGAAPRGILVGRLRARVAAGLLADPEQLTVRLVDGGGQTLGSQTGLTAAELEKLAGLGSESRPGRLLLAGRPSAYVPLAHLLAVAVVSGTFDPLPSPFRLWHLGLLAGVLAAAALAAWLVCRRAQPSSSR